MRESINYIIAVEDKERKVRKKTKIQKKSKQ
jgi:hypothetical protein